MSLPTTIPAHELLTEEQFKKVLPPQVSKTINQTVIDQINNTLADPDMYEIYRENLIGYGHILKDGKFKMSSYVEAIKYVSHKLKGDTNIDAFVKTFPVRYQDWINRGVASKDIASYITSYNKNKLVNLIYEQSMIPVHVLNQDNFQKAINVQVELMLTAKSEKVRSDAANSLMTHLKRPESIKIDLDIGVKEDSTLTQIRQQTMELAKMQQAQIAAGQASARETAEKKLIIDVEAKET